MLSSKGNIELNGYKIEKPPNKSVIRKDVLQSPTSILMEMHSRIKRSGGRLGGRETIILEQVKIILSLAQRDALGGVSHFETK